MKYLALYQDAVGHFGYVEIKDVSSMDAAIKKAVKEIFIGAEKVEDTIDALVKAYGTDFACEFHLKNLSVVAVSEMKEVDLSAVTRAFHDQLKKRQKEEKAQPSLAI